MRIWLVLLTLGVSLWVSASAHAQDSMEAVCQSIDRPNIDCQCVAKRISVYQKFAPTSEAKRMIVEQYRHALGLPNDHEAAMEAAYGREDDFMRRLALQESMDQIGGVPSSINDFEQGCVIAGAAPIPIEQSRIIDRDTEYSTEAYVQSCVKSIGETDQNQRFCQCSTARLTAELTDAEFEAYFRSFAQYDDANSRSELSRLRARSMGVSVEAYDKLTKSAGAKRNETQEANSGFCYARTWADNDLGRSAEERKLAGFEPGIASMAVPAPTTSEDLMTGEPLDRARKVLRKNCSNDGNSDGYCQCYMREFETRVVSKAPNENTALSWALMNGNGAMTNMDYVTTIQSIPVVDQQAAAMMLMDTSDLGETCPRMDATHSDPEPLGKTPADRMVAICIDDNEDETLCTCMVDNMQSNFTSDDFELLVDIREAEFRGAEDPFATVAQERGLSREEAETALKNNPAIMGGAMAMAGSMMQCVGGMPTMPAMPMMPGVPQQ